MSSTQPGENVDYAFERLYYMAHTGDCAQMKMFLRKYSKETILNIVNTLSSVQIPGLTALQSTVLLAACRNGHYQIVCYLVKECSADVQQVGSVMFDNEVIEGSPPLWVASAAGHKNIVEFLLNNGASVNATTKSNSTPLRAACYDGHIDIVKLLVKHGADIEIANRHGHTSLMIACYRGHIDVVRFLLEKGAQVNRSSLKGNTALHDCAEAGHVEIIKVLLTNGAVMQSDENRVTPILAAALCMNREIVNLLAQNSIGRYTSDGADAFELLGATVICKNSNLSLGVRYWRIAMSIRQSDPVNLSKDLSNVESVMAYDNIVEFRTMDELDALSVEPYAVHLNALLIYERVLGLKHPDTYYYIRYRGAVLADGGDYHRCLIFWLRALDLQAAHLDPLCVLTQNNFVSFVELFSHIKRVVPDLMATARPLICEVFRRLLAQMQRFSEKPAVHAKTCTCENESDDDSPLSRCYNIALHLLSLLAETASPPNHPSYEEDLLTLKHFILMMTQFVLPNGFNVLHAICHDQSVYDDFDLSQPPIATSVNRPLLLELAFEALGIGVRHHSIRDRMDCIDPVAFIRGEQQLVQRFVNCQDVSGCTPLHYACSLRLPVLVSKLLTAGASPSPLNSAQETPLHLAAVSCCSAEPVCCSEPLRLLLEAGAHPDCTNLSGRSPVSLLSSDDCSSLRLFPRIPRLACLAAKVLSKSMPAGSSALSLTMIEPDCLLHQIITSMIKLH